MHVLHIHIILICNCWQKRGFLVSLLYSLCLFLRLTNLLKFFLKCLEEKIDPAIPEFGSIGSGDLTQNASFGLSLIGKGKVWQNNKIRNSKSHFKSLKLKAPKFEGKDAMVLINHRELELSFLHVHS